MTFLRSFHLSIPVGIMVLLVLDIAMRPALVEESEGKTNYQNESFSALYAPDDYGVLRPHLNVDLSIAPSETFNIKTNALGMRMGDVSLAKKPNEIRIAVLGDCAAFGWGVGVEENFPSKLSMYLNQEGQLKYEILNFAAPGYTSFHALKEYERQVRDFAPDILILAVGLYDAFESRLSEPELYTLLEQQGLIHGNRGLTGLLNSYSSVGHWYVQKQRNRYTELIQKSVQERVQKNLWSKKVPADLLKTFLCTILDDQKKRNGKSILVNDNLLNFEGLSTLVELSETYKIPLLDIRTIFDGVGGFAERKKQFELDLEPSGMDYFDESPKTTYQFRVHSDDPRILASGISIVGNHPDLGDGVPNAVKMYDDGTHGDERAGDRVWSLQILMQTPQPIQFTFTVNGSKGEWGEAETGYEHSSKNRLFFHQFVPPASERVIHWHSPVYEVNRVPFEPLLIEPTSPIPNAQGQQTIARRLAKLVRDEVKNGIAKATAK